MKIEAMTNDFRDDLAFATALDQADELRDYRSQFLFPKHTDGSDAIYFCGNSLGLQPRTTRDRVNEELDDWARLGVEGHLHARHPWLPYHEFLAESTARLAGAKPTEVVVTNSLTANLHFLMVSFYRPTKSRYKILIEGDAFPSDKYAVAAQARFHGLNPEEAVIELRSKSGDPVIPTNEILDLIRTQGSEIALILLGGVNYYTGQAFEMEKIARAGHEAGCVVGFDLAHGMGNLVLNLHDWQVDFAAWCSYKYLNAGPGAVGGIFVHEKHHTDASLPRFNGWWGHNKKTRFTMPSQFDAIPTAEAWQLSNAPVLSMAALRASMEIFDSAGIERRIAKARRLTAYMEWLLQPILQKHGMRIITPTDPEQRGSQLSLQTGENGKSLHEKLTANGVICDWREPDVIRIAPAPLYNSFEDCWRFAEILRNA